MRKKVVIVVFYDVVCYGPRLLAAIAKQSGCDCTLLILKGERHHVPIFWERSRGEYSSYEYYSNGILRGSLSGVDPITNIEKQLFIDKISELKPDLIGISTRSPGYGICEMIIPEIERVLPNTPIVLGGWGPSLEPEKFASIADFVVFGEGEKAFSQLCRNIQIGESLESVCNLLYYRNGKLVKNPVATPLTDEEIDNLPFPDHTTNSLIMIDKNQVIRGKQFYNNRIYDCFAGRGCPLNCTYCMSSKYKQIYYDNYGVHCRKYRLRSVDKVLEEIDEAKKRGAEVIRFKDEVFPLRRAWLDEFLPRYHDQIGLPFTAYLRPEFHDNELITRIVEAGCTATLIGIQSGSTEVLRKIYKRKLSKDRIVEFARTLRNNNVSYIYNLIYQNPIETEEQMKETLNFLYQLPFAPMVVFRLMIFPDAPIVNIIKKYPPSDVPSDIRHWYAILYCMATANPALRELSKIITKHSLFKSAPYALSSFFIPVFVRELYHDYYNKQKYRATSFLFPKKQRPRMKK